MKVLLIIILYLFLVFAFPFSRIIVVADTMFMIKQILSRNLDDNVEEANSSSFSLSKNLN